MNNLNNNQFKNVLDLGASRIIKQRTGQAKAIRVNTPESPELAKHIDEALAVGNPPKKKDSMLEKFGKKIGIIEE